jgi:hypothetical protein
VFGFTRPLSCLKKFHCTKIKRGDIPLINKCIFCEFNRVWKDLALDMLKITFRER